MGVGFGGDHGKAVFVPDAADQHDGAFWHAEFVLALDGLPRFGGGDGFLPMRFEESGDGDDAATVLHGIAPRGLIGALDARIEHDPGPPGFLESPAQLSDVE